jgi:hypothetical protein
MTTLTSEGDGLIGKRIVYIARKVWIKVNNEKWETPRNGRNLVRCKSVH